MFESIPSRLTFICKSDRLTRGAKMHDWYRCVCGVVKEISRDSVSNGHTKSCGCYWREVITARLMTHGYRSKQTGKSTEYRSWCGMKERCQNPKNRKYADYGGRGITVCDRWQESFQNFLDDIGLKPTPKHSIDRIDNDGNYEPGNCRWATKKEQMRNQRKTRNITHNGRTQCISAWEQELGFPRSAIHTRLRKGWSVEKALTQPIKKPLIRSAVQ